MAIRRTAFTLVELLVVISIIGVLMGLLIPAVQAAKENSRRGQCMHNQRQLAMAVTQFHATNLFFPGYVNPVGDDFKAASWGVVLFPYIDRIDLWSLWSKRNFPSADDMGNCFFTGCPPVMTDSHPEAYIETFICPSDPPENETYSFWSYAVNGGFAEDNSTANPNVEQRCNGVFFTHFRRWGPFDPTSTLTTTVDYLSSHDGTSHTLMLTENVQQDAKMDVFEGAPGVIKSWGTWRNIYPRPQTSYSWDCRNRNFRSVLWHRAESPARRVNGDLYARELAPAGNCLGEHSRPSSQHPGGVVAVFCDGHVSFINQSIDYATYRQLMTSYGDQAYANMHDPDNRQFNDAHF